jgi:pimeloyl-ACP methyl ester carboxylesterase
MLSELLALETTQPVVLVGHSMGGILAMMHAARLPTSVKALVLLDPPVPNVTRWPRDPQLSAKLAFLRLPGIAAMVARQVTGMTPEQLVARQLSQATPHHDRIPREVVDATVRETASARVRDRGRGAQRAQFRAILDVVALLARPAQWRRELAGIDAPTLWLHGTDDPLAHIDGAQALASSHPHWQFRTREGVGHLPHLEDPAWTAQTIEEWLAHDVSRP